MMYKTLLALMFLALSADVISASTRPATKKSSSSGRIQQHEPSASPHSTGHAFIRSQQEQKHSKSSAPLTGWVKDFSGAVKEDFVGASRSCKKEDIIHECVVNYSWGLVGNF
jgi:hypothetical protein